jgi:membrane protein
LQCINLSLGILLTPHTALFLARFQLGKSMARKAIMVKHWRGNKFRIVYELLRDATLASIEGDFLSHSAALAYYTVFAVAPLFVIALAIAGFWFGTEAASRELFGQVSELIGKQGGDALRSLVLAANKTRTGLWATSLAIITLLAASTGVFVQLQSSLNHFWGVKPLPGRSLRNFLRHRLLSFAMVLGIGFLLLVSLIVNAGLSALGSFLGERLSAQHLVAEIANPLVSVSAITVLFTMIFKLLPDVKIAWQDVWMGGFVTALLFNGGKFLIGLYIARGSITSAYGAVGSLVIILAWVYYSSVILFFGAQLTRVFAIRFGTKPQPASGASIPALSAQ